VKSIATDSAPSILVTGGAGYIGSNCCHLLAQRGYFPVTVDNLTSGNRDFVKWGPLVIADVRNKTIIKETIEKYNVVAVVHLAASSSVEESVKRPDHYFENNVAASLSLLQAAQEANCRTIIFSSTASVYGHPGGSCLRENLTCQPANPYASSKYLVEQILNECRSAYGFRSTSLRFFNAAGADPTADLGENRANETHLIPRALTAIRNRSETLTVFGTDYDTPDGTAIRDYVHVLDVAEAHLLALQRLLAGDVGDTYNVGSGNGHSVTEVLAAITAVTGRKVPVRYGPRRPGDPPILISDPSFVKASLGFHTRHSQLANIVQSSCNWYNNKEEISAPLFGC
jgi:UDP-glucose 4-epimerase